MSAFYSNLPAFDDLYFDSKKTLCRVKLNGQYKNAKQNLYVFVFGPKGRFFSHEVAKGDDARDGFNAIIETFSKAELAVAKIYLCGADGTNLNTGLRRGIIRLLEVQT